jgi:hypothetical protein
VDEPEIQLDVVDFGQPSAEERRPGPRWPRWLLAGLAAVVVVFLVVQNAYRTTPSAAPSPTPTLVEPSRTSVPASPSPTGPVTTEAGHPLLGVTAGWELYALSSSGLVRVQPARGRVTVTPLPPLRSTGPVMLTVGRDWAIVRPLDVVPGYLVPDGQPARALTGALDKSPYAFPGPDPDHVWAPPPMDGPPPVMTLVDVNGRPSGPSISIPNGMDGPVFPDGTGYLLLTGPGGVYQARPDGIRRVTSGGLLAAGPTRWLTLECDERFRCDTVVIDRSTGTRRILPIDGAAPTSGPGFISPDGRVAAMVESDRAGVSVHLLDLAAGTDRRLDVPVNVGYADAGVVWSPDSRWLFMIGGTGTVLPVDGATGQVYDLGVPLPPVTQLAVRQG